MHWLYNSPMRFLRRWFLILSLIMLSSLSASAQPLPPVTVVTPGENSQVISPIEVLARVHPGEDGLLRLTLVDRSGDLLARQLVRVDAPGESTVEFFSQLAFEIPKETNTGILTVMTQDHNHRPVALRSVNVTLARDGEAIIEPQTSPEPWLTVTHPEPGMVIQSSPLLVIGTVTPINDFPLIFELLTERGGAIISKQLAVETPGQPMNFEVPLVYPPVTGGHDMRLIIRQPSGWVGVDAILDSVPITIAP